MPPLESEFFPASYDATTKVLSAILGAVLVGVAAGTQSALAGGIGALVLALGYAYSPRGYTIRNRSIIVRRLIGNIVVPLDAIREARTTVPDDFRSCIRLWGSGGLFGYYGLFRTSKLGKCTWYMTNRKHAVVVVTDAKTVVLSPDEVDRFLSAVGASVPVPASSPDKLFLDSLTSPSSGSWRVVLAIVGAALVIGAVSFTTAYSPGLPSYTLTAESLAIHDRFYSVTIQAASVDVERIRSVDVASDPAWIPVSRTNGFANAHYRAGWFRVANGQKVRMYTATGAKLVLLPPKGNTAPVLLEVKDPEAFVAELRQAWLR